jgi:glycosyltransferase involved in cell wall biosynthesis
MENTRKRLLYVCPHLSTGGQPQYTYKQIKHFIKDFDIEVVELSNSGGNAFVVQKNRIKSLCIVHTLGDDKSEILNVISEFKPDIIHFQEIPQFDLATNILDKIFTKDREYFILATTHGSFTNPSEIVYHPDKYVLVSEWSKQKFAEADLGVDLDLWEYPIEEYEFDKEASQKYLGLDPTWKHVLNVGLFSPGKNQAEIFAVARQLEKYKIKFHFVGNQAGNYEHYWLPIMKHKPDNCVIWGERDDTDIFYSACDMFYFSSTLELNPLSVKEALSFKLPCLFRKLHTYLDTYDSNPLVQYITDDLKLTKRFILEKLQPEFNEIPGWFAYQDLYTDVVKNAGNDDVFVEVGAWFGKSTNYLAQQIRESKKNIKFTTVDTWKGTDDEDIHQNIVGAFNGDIFYEFVDNTILSDNYGAIDMIKDTSRNAANNFSNGSIDYIMLDAGHSYDALKDDLEVWYNKVKPGGIVSGDDYGVFYGVTQAADEFFYGQFEKGFRSFIRKKPRIQIRHLLTRPDDVRERVSMSSIKQLAKYGIDYLPMVNKPYEGLPPTKHCKRPDQISDTPGNFGNGLGPLTGGHYGCFQAHRGALETMSDEYDYTLVFEADAFIYTGLEEFVQIVNRACFLMERDDVYFMGLSDNASRNKERIDDLFSKTAANQDLAHAYLIPNKTKQWWVDRFNDTPWEGYDLWLTDVFYKEPKLRYTTNKIYVKQSEGFSLIDKTIKTWS